MCTRNIQGKQTIIEHIHGSEIRHTFIVEENAEFKGLFIVDDALCEIDIQCTGKNSKALVNCIYLSKNGVKVTGNVQGILKADHTEVEIYLLSLLGDKADSHIDGGVVISPDIVKASGHLLEENVILGKKVKIKTLPMLDVRSSDVSASHGAKIDRLDEGKLFYMMAKGLDQKQAQKLIVQGYIERICDSVNLQDGDEKTKIISGILEYFAMDLI